MRRYAGSLPLGLIVVLLIAKMKNLPGPKKNALIYLSTSCRLYYLVTE